MTPLECLEILRNPTQCGIIYCIDTTPFNDDNLVKLGRWAINDGETTERSLCRLLQRYKTHCPYVRLVKYQTTYNRVEAEKLLFKLLKGSRWNREFFFYDKFLIDTAFNKVSQIYPSINSVLSGLTSVQNTLINKVLQYENQVDVVIP